MELYAALKTLHIVSAAVLFGTGLGSVFYLWRAYRGGDTRVIARVAGDVVFADWVFTTPAVIVQPLTGAALAAVVGHSFGAFWLWAAIALYVVAGLCWLPVVGLQLRLRDLAREAVRRDAKLPPIFARYMRIWAALGWVAFAAVAAIFVLMVARPQ